MEKNISFSQKAFNKGVNDVMTLKPIREAIGYIAKGTIRTKPQTGKLIHSIHRGSGGKKSA